jgi:hypothetical protein
MKAVPKSKITSKVKRADDKKVRNEPEG